MEDDNLTKAHFEGAIESTVRCETCSSASKRTEPFVDLQLNFDQNTSEISSPPETINDMLQRIQADEILDQDQNLYFCEACNTKVPRATRSFKFTSLPKTSLLLTICRFYYDRNT